MRADELLRRLNRELRLLKKSGLDAVDLDLIREWMDGAQEDLAMDPSLQKSIARFPWSTASVPKLVGLLTRVAGALADRVSDEYRGGLAHGAPHERNDRWHYRYRAEAHDEGDSHRLFFSR